MLACAALLLLLAASAPAPAAGFTATKTPPAVPADIKYIRCSVCQLMAKQIVSTYQDLKVKKGKHVRRRFLAVLWGGLGRSGAGAIFSAVRCWPLVPA